MVLNNEGKLMVVKRNGRLIDYDGSRIILAIKKSILEGSGSKEEVAELIEEEIHNIALDSDYSMNVEEIQDTIEELLIKHGKSNSARRFIRYRLTRENERNKKWEMNDLQYDIWSQKYEWDNEGFEGFLNRVSNGNEEVKKLIRQKKFLFGGRILSSRGLQDKGRKVTFSNCYVITPPEDNIESIFEAGSKLARTFSYGGGCGIHIGKLRPNGSNVNNAALTTSGSTSFMELYSTVTSIIGQKGRRGALMISLPCDHPDIEEFIDIKKDLDKVTKANISIMLSDDFMKAVKEDIDFKLSFYIDSTGQKIERVVNAKKLFIKFSEANWDMAEPGALYWTRIENWNLLSNDQEFTFEGVNPCAEEPLPAGGSCLLGSSNLSEFVLYPFTKNAEFDFDKFREASMIATQALNEVLDEGLPLHPLQEQRDSVNDWRQIGLGLMGLHDMLIKLGIKYGSEESIKLCDKIGYTMFNASAQKSALLAKEFGTYPKYKKDLVMSTEFFKSNANEETINLVNKYGLRNSQLLTIAPTGSLSTMLGISGGIEPIYQVAYTRKTQTLNDGEDTYYTVFTPIAREYMEFNNIKNESDLPKDLFVTAMSLDYEERLKMQSIWQEHIDASISSTVNVPNEFTIEDTFDLYIKSWEYGLKGVTIFRDGCRRLGVLGNHGATDTSNLSAKQLQELLDKQIMKELANDPNKCPKCGGKLIMSGGCSECEDCAYSPCAI